MAQVYLERIRSLDPSLGAFLTVNEGVLEEARSLDPSLPLAGLVVAVKDNIVTKGIPTTAGSRLLQGFVPPYEATAVARLKALGALVIGKTNLDEFGMGSSTEHSAFFPSRNPFDPTRVPGGPAGKRGGGGGGSSPFGLRVGYRGERAPACGLLRDLWP